MFSKLWLCLYDEAFRNGHHEAEDGGRAAYVAVGDAGRVGRSVRLAGDIIAGFEGQDVVPGIFYD